MQIHLWKIEYHKYYVDSGSVISFFPSNYWAMLTTKLPPFEYHAKLKLNWTIFRTWIFFFFVHENIFEGEQCVALDFGCHFSNLDKFCKKNSDRSELDTLKSHIWRESI